MRVYLVLLAFSFIASLVRCQNAPPPPPSPVLPPIVQAANFQDEFAKFLDEADKTINTYITQDEINQLPLSQDLYRLNKSSEIYSKGEFVAKMTRSATCRTTLEKWECPTCKTVLPDGVIVRTIKTFPLDTVAYVIVSAKNKAIYVTVRGATSLADQVVYHSFPNLVNHPLIPGAKIHEGTLKMFLDLRNVVYDTVADQLALHSSYSIEVLGHSVGGAAASLLTVDLFQRFQQKRRQIYGYTLGSPRVGDRNYAKYIGDNNISLKRFVNEDDVAAHGNPLSKGYEHEGDEFWIKSNNPVEIIACPGPHETKSCSTSTETRRWRTHLTYFGILQDCTAEEVGDKVQQIIFGTTTTSTTIPTAK